MVMMKVSMAIKVGGEGDSDDCDGVSSSDGDDVGSVMIIAWLPCITGRPRGRSWPGVSEQLHPLHTNMLHNAQCTSIVHKLQCTKQPSILERKYEAKPRKSQTFLCCTMYIVQYPTGPKMHNIHPW